MSEWVDIGDVQSVSARQPYTVEVDGTDIVVVRCADGFYAIENRCTHDGESFGGADVEAEDCEIICPRHFARFCLKTGEPLSPPAYEPVRTFKVREENGRVLLEAPD
jgi:3-phenylpropionate/trans-cinnamate dioxygenase ferredoxin component